MTKGIQGFALLLALLATTAMAPAAMAQAAAPAEETAQPAPALATQLSTPLANKAAVPADMNGVGIAATVNDEPITMSDINNRVDLYLLGAPGTPPPEVRAQLNRQILSKLIDEKLQIQSAKSLGITIGDDQVMDAFATVSGKNNVSADEFKARLTAQGIKVSTLYDQLRAEIAWGQVIRRKLRPQINIGEPEIESEFDQMEHGSTASAGAISGEATPSATPVTDPAAAEAPQADAAPAPAPAPAAVTAAAPAPAQQTEIVALKQIMIPIAPDDSADIINAKMARAVKVQQDVKTCAAFDAQMKDFAGNGTLDMGRGPMIALPPALQALIRPLAVGTPSAPVRTGDGRGIAILIVCERTMGALPPTAAAAPEAAPVARLDRTNQADRETVANKLGLDRLNKLADRYLRDLRATAYIDKRI